MSIELFRTALQTNSTQINEFTCFTNKMTKVSNYKTCNFVQNKPEHLWPLLL